MGSHLFAIASRSSPRLRACSHRPGLGRGIEIFGLTVFLPSGYLLMTLFPRLAFRSRMVRIRSTWVTDSIESCCLAVRTRYRDRGSAGSVWTRT